MVSIVKNHGNETNSARGPISKREAKVAHERSFGNLADVAKDAAGLPGDQVPYWDPMGFTNTRKEAIDMKSTLFEKWKPAFDVFNGKMLEGIPLADAAKEVSKEVGRSFYSIPIYFTPDVFITDQRDTVLADMMARTAVQEDTIKVDELTDVGDADSFNEPGTNSGTDENWPENDDEYSNLEYEVVPYGRRNKVTDFVQLAANTLRSTRALTEDQQVRAIRFYEENQIIQGTENDADGFEGLRDFADDEGHLYDGETATISVSDVRTHLRRLRRRGASRENIVHVTDHKTFNDLHDELDDFTRYESPSEQLSFGWQTLDIDGTPVMESHGAPNEDGERYFVSFDASANYMGMLQDVTMHPLARDSPQEEFATDAYGTLVSESPSRVEFTENLA